MPPNGEARAHRFYADVLGMSEIQKPPELAKRGGVWFASGDVQLHLGVEENFQPAKKAHPALRCANFDSLLKRIRENGIEVIEDDARPAVRRCYVHDPFGNRLEFIADPNSLQSE